MLATIGLIALLCLAVTLRVEARPGEGSITPSVRDNRIGLKVERRATNRVLERRCRDGRHWPQVRSVWAIPRRHVEAVLQRELRRQRYARTLSSRCATPRAVGKYLAARRGWTGSQWAALDELWGDRESGWNPTARNPTSGACGIPQQYPCRLPVSRSVSAIRAQIRWGLAYISQRYGSPVGAIAFHNARGWY